MQVVGSGCLEAVPISGDRLLISNFSFSTCCEEAWRQSPELKISYKTYSKRAGFDRMEVCIGYPRSWLAR